ncbi:MAG: PorV/PorQ family protein [Elusimicrobiota bacterium]|nr:PorV/PorQ family protein [Elusimicrobiota bacterium]
MPTAAIKKLSCAAIAIIAGAASVCAGGYSNSAVGTSSGKFLSFGSSARAAAMGEAYCAAARAADSVRYNPAAMVRIEANSAEVMHANYLAGTFLDQAAFAGRLVPGQAIGISALQMSYGSIARTDETGYQTGTARPAGMALTGAYARKLENLGGSAIGVSAGYVRSTIVSSARTFTASLGLLSPVFGPYGTQLALVAENLTGTLKFDQKAEPLPMTFKLGGIMQLKPDWVLALELAAPRDNAPYAAIGTEKWFKARPGTKLAIRAGYNMRSADMGGLAGFSTGIGISFNALALDYALIPFGGLGYSHKLTLGFNFGKGS